MNSLKRIYKHPCNFAFKKKINNDGRFPHGVYLAEKWKKMRKRVNGMLGLVVKQCARLSKKLTLVVKLFYIFSIL